MKDSFYIRDDELSLDVVIPVESIEEDEDHDF